MRSQSAAICREILHYISWCSSACPVYIYTFVYGNVLPLLKIMYIYHRIPVYTIYCISTLYLIQYIVVTLLNRSKTVVGFFPIAAICRVLPNKSQPEHVFYPLPWQMNKIFIMLFFASLCRILPYFTRVSAIFDFIEIRHKLASPCISWTSMLIKC